MGAQNLIGGFAEPAGMAELEGQLQWRTGQKRAVQKGGQPFGIGGEVGRQLEEQGSQPGGGSRRLYGGEEGAQGSLTVRRGAVSPSDDRGFPPTFPRNIFGNGNGNERLRRSL